MKLQFHFNINVRDREDNLKCEKYTYGHIQYVALLSCGQAVDQDRSGRISSSELQKALLNSNREFRYDAVRLLFNMVDKNRYESRNQYAD